MPYLKNSWAHGLSEQSENSWNGESVKDDIWPGCIRIPVCCSIAKLENDDYEKKKKYRRNQTAGQKFAGHVGTVDPGFRCSIHGLNTKRGTILFTNCFSGNIRVLDLVLSEIRSVGGVTDVWGPFLLVCSICWIFPEKSFLSGDLSFFKNQPDRVGSIVAGLGLRWSSWITQPYYYVSFTTAWSWTDCDSSDPVAFPWFPWDRYVGQCFLNFSLLLPFLLAWPIFMAGWHRVWGIQAIEREPARLMKGKISGKIWS